MQQKETMFEGKREGKGERREGAGGLSFLSIVVASLRVSGGRGRKGRWIVRSTNNKRKACRRGKGRREGLLLVVVHGKLRLRGGEKLLDIGLHPLHVAELRPDAHLFSVTGALELLL